MNWPTSGTRGQSSQRGTAGFPGGGSATMAAAAGFLSPAAASALAGAGAAARQAAVAAAQSPVARAAVQLATPAIAPASQLASTTLPRTAMLGLRFVPGLGWALAAGALALAAWELSQWYMAAGPTGVAIKGTDGWTRGTFVCSGSPAERLNRGYLSCADQVWAPATYNNLKVVTSTTTQVGFFRDVRLGSDGYYRGKMVEYWNRQVATAPPPYLADGPALFLPAEEGDELLDEYPYPPAVIGDPLIKPGEVPWLPPVLPYRFLPARVPNPERSPVERTHRGNRPPRWVVSPLPGDEDEPEDRQRRRERQRPPRWRTEPASDPVEAPASPDEFVWPGHPSTAPGAAPGETVPAPSRRPGALPDDGTAAPPSPAPGVRPGMPIGDPLPGDLPGWVAEPGTQPETPIGLPIDTGAGPVREEWPEGAAGPTITYGPPGPPIGSHSRSPPKRREKERKARAITANGAVLIRRMVNPLSEALEALDCFYGALPKALRWEIQKADWARQRAAGADAGFKSPRNDKNKQTTERTSWGQSNVVGERGEGHRFNEGLSVPLDFLGLDGQTLSVPGTAPRGAARGTQYAELGANRIQPLSPQAKAAAVYRHADKIDLDAAVKCIGADMLEDMAYGAVGRAQGAASRRMGHSTGMGTGPTF